MDFETESFEFFCSFNTYLKRRKKMKDTELNVLNNASGLVVRQGLFNNAVITADFGKEGGFKTIVLSHSMIKNVTERKTQRNIPGKIPVWIRILRKLGCISYIRTTGAVVFFKETTNLFFPLWSGNSYDLVVVGTEELCRALSNH
jgi:hypothetical protein